MRPSLLLLFGKKKKRTVGKKVGQKSKSSEGGDLGQEQASKNRTEASRDLKESHAEAEKARAKADVLKVASEIHSFEVECHQNELREERGEMAKLRAELVLKKEEKRKAQEEVSAAMERAVQNFKSSKDMVDIKIDFAQEAFLEGFQVYMGQVIENFPNIDLDHLLEELEDRAGPSCIDAEEKKDDSQEGEKPTSVETSNEFNVAAGISRVSSGEEKTSGGTEMVQEKKDEGERAPKSTETITEKKSEVLESSRKTLGETFKEHDMEEKNVFAASAAERVGDSEFEKGKELAKDTAETREPDDGNLAEPSKDDFPKQDQESPKQEAPKASQRHSNNIISKVKHSIVKAKRAILGKSPSSKTMSAGTKDEIKVN
ncbi:hypothetical protein COCNU_scaffold000795G000010 [Cocos nucifera]|nr:hypothetical protein [Cocos nucifera]